MRIIKFLLIALSPGFLALTAKAQEAKPRVQIAGTRVSIIAPQGLTPAKNFAGFMDEESATSVMITELPAPFSALSAGFTPEQLASKGMALIDKKDISLGSHPGYLLHIKQEAYGTMFLKWLAVTGNEKETVMITATFPEEMAGRLSAPLQQVVLSALWNADAVKNQFDGLNFSISDNPSLKIANRMGSTLILTPTGTLPGKPSDEPFLIIGASPSMVRVEPEARKEFAERELKSVDKVTDVVIKTSEAITLSGLPGQEIIGAGQDKTLQKKVVIYMALLFDTDSTYLIMGLTKPEAEKQNIELFKTIAGTFKLNKK